MILTQKSLPVITIVLLLLIFPVGLGQACSYVRDKAYISDLTLTSDPHIVFAKIKSISGIDQGNIAINLTSLRLVIRPTNVTEIENDGLVVDSENYSSSYKTINDSYTQWLLHSSNSSLLLNVTLPIAYESVKTVVVNPNIRRAFLIDMEYKGIYNNASCYSVYFNSSNYVKRNIYWDSLGAGHLVYPEESLLVLKPGCCYCVSNYYYRFNSTDDLEYINTTYIWSSTIIDIRTKYLITIDTLVNRLLVFNYSSTSTGEPLVRNFTEVEIRAILNRIDAIPAFSIPLLVITLVIISRKRKK